MGRRIWSKLGGLLGRAPVAVVLVLAALVLFLGQALSLRRNLRIKVEASDLLPADHPKNKEFDFIRASFSGSSRGFFFVVEAPLPRLREVVPQVAAAARALPDVDFIRWRIEREWFEQNLLLFQSGDHLRRQAAYLGKYRDDVQRLVARGRSFSDFLDGMSDIIDGEQELGAPTDEAEKDAKLARDLHSLAPFLETSRTAIERLAAGEPLDERHLDRGLEELLLRGWFDADKVARLDRELLVPEDAQERRGPTMALVWVATRTSDLDPEFAARFMGVAGVVKRGLELRFPDVSFRLTGGVATYDTWQRTVRSDFQSANVLGLVAVLLLLVIGFRSVAPFLLLMLFLFEGTLGTLFLQNLLFGGVNMIATAGGLAILGIGSDYGVIFLLTLRRELQPARRERDRSGRMARKQWLRHVRQAIGRALGEIGGATSVGCIVAAASFLALAGADVVPFIQRAFGFQASAARSFQPIRELGAGGALGLIYCLALMLVALPAAIYLLEWVRTHPAVRRVARLARPLARRVRRGKRFTLWRGRARLFLETDHEKRWFRALAAGAVRRRFRIVAAAMVLGIAALVVGLRVEWSTGQREVEPRHSEAVQVSNRVEQVFGKSHENLLVYGPLDVIRRFHRRIELLKGAPGTNVGDVASIDDFLPDADERQEDKIALAREIEASLAGIRAPLPPSDLLLSGPEILWLLARASDLDRRLAGTVTDRPAAAIAIAEARGRLAAVRQALSGAQALTPAGEWSAELVTVDGERVAGAAAALRALADRELESGAPPARVAAWKALARGLEASARASGSTFLRRDLGATALALGDGLPELTAQLRDAAAGPSPVTPVALVRLRRHALLAPLAGLDRFVADSAIHGLAVRDGAAFSALAGELEGMLELLALRARPTVAEAGGAHERAVAAVARLRRSIDSLRSFAAASGLGSVAPAAPPVFAALDALQARLIALPPERAEAVARALDGLFAERLFDRFSTTKRAAAGARRPLGIDDVPESARRLFAGRGPDGAGLYLARVSPARTMLERRPYQELDRVVSGALADVTPAAGTRAGSSGFEALLNLATDYLETTFSGAMIAVTLFVLTILYAYNRSVLATVILLVPTALGTVMALALMVLLGQRVTIFTVVALPIIVGVATDSSLQIFREYWGQLEKRGRAPLQDVMGESGRMVTLNSLSTVLPFGMMMLGQMKGLVALGTLLAFGILVSLVAKLILLPCLISIAQDLIVPAVQYGCRLWPGSRAFRVARLLLGRWHRALPLPDAGFTSEPIAELRTIVMTGRRPPLNLMEAAFVTRGVQIVRAFLRDPDYQAVVMRSGLAQHYHVRDDGGELVRDESGKPKRIAAALVESSPLPRGYTLVGPIRPFGAGADLRVMAANPLNALFTLKAGIEQSELLWYAKKPIVFLGEGEVVAGWFEVAMCCNFFAVTRHAVLGAPEVKRGLTLPLGAPALSFRAGSAIARQLMASGELISGEEAVAMGIADALIPDGEDPTEFAFRTIRSPEFHDRIRQTAMLREYGPPLRKLVQKSVGNYIRLLRSPETRRRLRSFMKESA